MDFSKVNKIRRVRQGIGDKLNKTRRIANVAKAENQHLRVDNSRMSAALKNPITRFELEECRDELLEYILKELISKSEVSIIDDALGGASGYFIVDISIPDLHIRRMVRNDVSDIPSFDSEVDDTPVRTINVEMFKQYNSSSNARG